MIGLICAVTSTLFFIAPSVMGGHYKVRAPPPPPVPPASLHYGPHPPHRYHSPSYIHPYRSPPPPHYPSTSYHHPRMPYYHKSTPREYHHPRLAAPAPIFQPKIATSYVPAIPAVAASTYNLWGGYNAFRAPAVKETFISSAPVPSYTPSISLIKDDDKGPIHTIPAPNLGGGPDAAHLAASAASATSALPHSHSHSHHHHHKKQDPEADLVAVLRHGITNVNVPHSSAYQVTEDPSIHTPEKDTPLHFAPDPDPNTPTLKVPATTDPHSIPSNGQVPLDIYLQQEADKQAASTESSNALTAQDLFNLLNYQPNSSPQIPSFPVFNSDSLLTNTFPSTNQFSPQFQTFNYDERTQQGAFGSNSFPPSSMSLGLGNSDLSGHDNLLDLKSFPDNDLEGSEKDEVFHKIVDPDNEIDPKPAELKKKSLDRKESTAGKNEITRTPKNPTTNDLPQSNPKFEIRVPQDVKDKIKNDFFVDNKIVPCPPGTACVLPVGTQPSQLPDKSPHTSKPEEGVQLQKSIQIYSTTYSTSVKEATKNAESTPKSTNEAKKGRGIAISDIPEDHINPQLDAATANLPFGARIRPKRF